MSKYEFEQELLRHIENRGWTQAELARRMQKSPSTVSKWLEGINKIKYEDLYKLCKLLELSEKDTATLFQYAGYNHISPVVPTNVETIANHLVEHKSYDATLYIHSTPTKKPEKLFGHQRLFAYLCTQLEQGKHILLTGFGGTGKTALAATITSHWIEESQKSVLWLGGDSEDIDLLFEAVAVTFNKHNELAAKKGNARVEFVRSVLANEKVTLVVLDNLSYVALLSQVRAAIPQGTPLLVTSRYDAANMDECIQMSALEPMEAIDLLAHHADNSHIPAAHYQAHANTELLCQRLAFHPLGIVIAGAWLKHNRRPISDLLKYIEAGVLSSLTVEIPLGAGYPGRDTVLALLERTYHQLSNIAKRVFRAFGVLPEAQATKELLGIFVNEPLLQVEIALDELVSWNFATRDGSNFYSLHEIVHHYGIYLQTRSGQRDRLDKGMQTFVTRYAKNHKVLAKNLSNIIRTAEMLDDVERVQLIRPLLLMGFGYAINYRLELLALLNDILIFLDGQLQVGSLSSAGKEELFYYMSRRGHLYFRQQHFAQAHAQYHAALSLAPDLEGQVKLNALIAKSLAFDHQTEESQRFFDEAQRLAGTDESLRSIVLEEQIDSILFQNDYVNGYSRALEMVKVNRRVFLKEPDAINQERLLRSLVFLGIAGEKIQDYSDFSELRTVVLVRDLRGMNTRSTTTLQELLMRMLPSRGGGYRFPTRRGGRWELVDDSPLDPRIFREIEKSREREEGYQIRHKYQDEFGNI